MLFINLLKNKKKILNSADTPYVNGCFPNRFNYNTIKVINRFQLYFSGVASKFLLNKFKICKKGFVLNFFLNWIRMLTKKNVSGVTNRLLFYKYKIFENVLNLNLILDSFACSRKKIGLTLRRLILLSKHLHAKIVSGYWKDPLGRHTQQYQH